MIRFEPETYEEILRMGRCVELTKHYELSKKALDRIYEFLAQNPDAQIKGGKANLSLVKGMDTANAEVIMARCINKEIDGLLLTAGLLKLYPHYTPSGGSGYSGGSSSNNNNKNNNNNNNNNNR